mgnify:CR=1 FL=1
MKKTYFNVDGFIAQENSRNMPAALKEDSDGMPEDPMGYLYSLSADALPGYAHLLLDEDFLDDTAFRQYQKYANFADFHKKNNGQMIMDKYRKSLKMGEEKLKKISITKNY